MNTQTFKIKLYEILKKDSRLFDEEENLNQTLLFDLIDKVDEKVIGLLLDDDDTKEKFFTKIKDVYVFKTNDFKFFIDENKIFNSFTQYKNQIGLSDGKEFIVDRDEVVLNFPFKDCVLEGGQTTEDGEDIYFQWEDEKLKDKLDENGNKIKDGRKNVKEVDIPAHYEMNNSKRKEIFFNQVLAKDEIDRLFDPKAFVNWKRYTKKGQKKVENIKRNKKGTIKENLIIKGNNLLALHSLKSEFSGKIKLIYIDPPYNTGNDSFQYNDSFNHSSWLTFMKNRLEVAKTMLKDNGLMFIQIDDKEVFYLKILCDEIFGKNNFISSITVKMSHLSGMKMSHRKKKIPKIKEHILVFAKNKNSIEFNEEMIETEWDEVLDRYTGYLIRDINNPDDYTKWKRKTVREVAIEKGVDVKNKKEYEQFKIENANNIFRTATNDSEEFKKTPKDNKFRKIITTTKLEKFSHKREEVLFASKYVKDGKVFSFIGDIWDDIGINNLHNEGGVEFKNGKKPYKLLERIIRMTTDENDIVLDFFSGSGTTADVAISLNRQFITIEQLDYIENLPLKRIEYRLDSISENEKQERSFLYLELAKWNEIAKKTINNAKSLKELEALFEEMYEKYFLNYNLKIKEFKDKVIKEEGFLKLTLEEQKRMFLTMLDLNQMYIPESEMEDGKYDISEEDQVLTKMFYGEK